MKSARFLTKPAEYKLVYKEGKSKADYLLAIRMRASGGEITRIGIVTGKKIGGAVVRNKVKRRLREITNRLAFKDGYDIVIIARHQIAQADYTQIESSVNKLLLRAELIDKE